MGRVAMPSTQPLAVQERAATTIQTHARKMSANIKQARRLEEDFAPWSEATKERPARANSNGMGSSHPPTAGLGALHAMNMMSSMVSTKTSKAREERERQKRIEAASLSFDELFAQRERDQAVKALSDIPTLKRDLKKVRHRLQMADRWLLSQEGTFVRCWDIITLVALLYTVFVTPYEIGFLSAETAALWLEVCNYIMLVIFTGGIVVRSSLDPEAARVHCLGPIRTF